MLLYDLIPLHPPKSNRRHFSVQRLTFSNLEVRDHYFTKLKLTIEMSKITEDRKTVVLCHSMGSNVFYYFLKWVESDKGGKGGPKWVEEHIETFVNIAGPMLGLMSPSFQFLFSSETLSSSFPQELQRV